MDIFIKDFERGLHEHFESAKLDKEEVLEYSPENTPLNLVKKRKLTKKQYQMLNKDILIN